MKKHIPGLIGGICLLAAAITALIVVPRFTKPQEAPTAGQYAYAVEGEPMVEPKEAAHGKDYEIEWTDPALEQIMRLYLNKKDGPILHSDVWDIHAVYLRSQYRFFTDAQSKDGYLPDEGGVVSKEPLPQIKTLADFRHFDSLQLLELNGQKLTGLSGLELLQNLSTVNLTACGITDAGPLAKLDGVNKLVLDGNALSDVEPLAGMERLTWLSLRGCGLTDITPFTKLTGLTWLDVSNVQQGPGTIKDYTPIAELDSLQYLGLGNITDLTEVSFCTGLKKLETVDLQNSGVDKLDAKKALQQVKTIMI